MTNYFLKILIENIIQEILLEDKWDDVIRQYSTKQNGNVIKLWVKDWKKEKTIPVKYAEWATKMIYKLIMEPEGGVENNWVVTHIQNGPLGLKYWLPPVIIEFDELAKQGLIKNKDINSYKTIEELTQAVKDGRAKISKRKEKEAKKTASKKVFDNEDWLVIEPLTKDASCYYGKGTQWCISATESDNYFDTYKERGKRFVFIISKKQPNYKVAISFSSPQETSPDNTRDLDIEIFGADDETMNPSELTGLPADLLTAVNKHIKTDIFEPFSPEAFIERLPQSIKKYEQFMVKAPNKNVIEAINRIADEGMAYLPNTLLYFRNFLNAIIKRAKFSEYQPNFQPHILWALTIKDKSNLNLPKHVVDYFVRDLVSKKLNVDNALVEPFIWQQTIMTRLVRESLQTSNPEKTFVTSIYQISQGVAGEVIFNELTLQLDNVKRTHGAEYLEQLMWSLADKFIEADYNFNNLILADR